VGCICTAGRHRGGRTKCVGTARRPSATRGADGAGGRRVLCYNAWRPITRKT